MRHGVDKECVLVGVPELDQRCDDNIGEQLCHVAHSELWEV